MDIEEVAATDAREDPARRHRPGRGPAALPVPPAGVRARLQGRADRAVRVDRARALPALPRDATPALVEVNPLIVTKDGSLVALDAKINIDANALFRQKALAAMRDPSQEDAMERAGHRARPQLRLARRQHRLHGQRRRPRDGDDGPDQAARRRAGELPRRRRRRDGRARDRGVQADPVERPNVRAILVNIFGGIVRCDLIAEGIMQRGQEGRRERCRWSCASRARMREKAREMLAAERARDHRRHGPDRRGEEGRARRAAPGRCRSERS